MLDWFISSRSLNGSECKLLNRDLLLNVRVWDGGREVVGGCSDVRECVYKGGAVKRCV